MLALRVNSGTAVAFPEFAKHLPEARSINGCFRKLKPLRGHVLEEGAGF
jgi:hypothetical protein